MKSGLQFERVDYDYKEDTPGQKTTMRSEGMLVVMESYPIVYDDGSEGDESVLLVIKVVERGLFLQKVFSHHRAAPYNAGSRPMVQLVWPVGKEKANELLDNYGDACFEVAIRPDVNPLAETLSDEALVLPPHLRKGASTTLKTMLNNVQKTVYNDPNS